MTTSTTPRTERDLRASYVEACAALKALANLVVAADDAQHEPPPGAVYGKGTEGDMAGIGNPTLDVVLDPRRAGLADEVRELDEYLRVSTLSMRARAARLEAALDRWQGVS